jgi:Mg-chelatase subunit ChlD
MHWTDMLMDQHEDKAEEGASEGKARAEGMTISYEGWTPNGRSLFYDPSHIKVRDDFTRDEGSHYNCIGALHMDTSVANGIRRHIQAQNRTKFSGNRLSGKRINKRALKRIKTGTREYNRKVFQTREDKKDLNTCITLLVDWSGSMSGSRATIAASAAATLAECFGRVLGVPVEVLGHTTHDMTPRMLHIKEFDDKCLPPEELHRRFNWTDMSGNADGDALLYAYDRIRQRKEKRKIIIAIADGNPAQCRRGDPATALHEAITCIRESKDVELYGIGAQHQNIRKFYGEQSQVITKLDELGPVLLEVAKEFVSKARR